MSFDTLGLGPIITGNVRSAGYEQPTAIQSAAIPPVLTGRDLIGIAQTGTGKTAAFVLPILARLASGRQKKNPRALILTPTRELAVQIEQNVRIYGNGLGLRYATIYGGVGEQPQIAALRRGVDIVVATPGRLIDLMDRRAIVFDDLEFAVLDEADRMLDIGFLPAIRKIAQRFPRTRQTLLFSATLSPEIEKVAAEFLTDPVATEVAPRSRPVDSVRQSVLEVPKTNKLDLLLRLLRDPALEQTLIFSRTRHGADRIARKLTSSGISAATIHSSRTQRQRLAALEKFRSGEVRVLVATDIAARGIDIEGISHVINFDFPTQPEDYVHRIGRTGRAEATGDAVTFLCEEDLDSLRKLERLLGRTIERTKVAGFDMPAFRKPAPRVQPPARRREPSHPHSTRRGEARSRSGRSR